MDLHHLNSIKFINKYAVYILLAILFICHLAFINADPDISISFSRGPYTDEGAYTSQIKNFVTNGDLTFNNSPCFLITPLFGALFLVPFKIFGTSIFVSRLVVLILTLLSLFFIARINDYLKSIVLLIIPIILLEYVFFHYTHYSMAEILCIVSVLMGIIYAYKAMLDTNSKKSIYLSAIFMSLAWFLKIQFVYIIFLFPVFVCFWLILSYISEKKIDKQIFLILKKYLSVILILAVIYIVVWYLPNRNQFEKTFLNILPGILIETGKLNFKGIVMEYYSNFVTNIFSVKEIKVFVLIFVYSLAIAVFLFFSKRTSRDYKILLLLSIAWILIELHKFSMYYLPTRYLISLYFPMGLIIILTIKEGISLNKFFNKRIKILLIVLLMSSSMLVVLNISSYIRSYNRRTYAIKEINDYFKQYDYANRPVMGAWAPALTREAKTISYPILENYYNDKKIIETFHPKVLIIEKDEEYIDISYKNEILAITQNADSVIYKKIGNWGIEILWLK